MLTRHSLLGRMRRNDAASWDEFYYLYEDLIYGLARRHGLNHFEAQDVSQDVFLRLAGSIHTFAPSKNRGSFRRWLMNLTAWRIADRYRDRMPERVEGGTGFAAPAHDGTRTVERIADPQIEDRAVTWERDWRQSVYETAKHRLALRIPAKHFQLFELHVCQRWSVLRISRELGINPGKVYVISHRVTRMLHAEVKLLESQIG